ncbi:gamma-glutamylcyclotransferase family protein [Aspergillus glaucus CBS 516.65]|uniref:Putative gamma-glutamylcyclotransferase n=1 Tax=Aspergillus glaucus CBS 516.65 TaxID=1160497 RepID=A0A1L9VRF5_ASPGL|nr:hypothetical protein ASPGLDRAFT_44287 [Aspergillus glaucus CBS 516.65]OJJ86487.1 hypothetical protein ASPGLDRAFT_44287 [Aspergillus glaucus CBS 516.65]
MARKFMVRDLNPIDPARLAPKPYVEKYYFFYGTLMDPSMLTRVLNLDHKPDLRPAYILNHKMKMWGPYPAVLDGVAEGQRINGVAYKVKSEDDEKKLAAYETGMYRGKGVMVHFGGGGKEKERVVGCMFVWNADEAVLKAGMFNMGGWLEWERRMGE